MSPKLPDYTVNTLLPPTTPTTLPVARSIPRTHPAPPPAYDIVQLGLCNDLGEYVYERALTPYISQTPSFRQDGALSCHSATLDVSERCSTYAPTWAFA